MLNQQERYFAGRKNIFFALLINVVLFGFKLFAGIVGRSQAMVTDAVHTLSDILATTVVLLGLKFGTMPQDGSHPYGHGKFETMAAAAVTLILIGVGFDFLSRGVYGVLQPYRTVPTILPLVAALFSIVLKESLYQYTIRVGRHIKSPALVADAWHHRSDAFSSIPAFLGILGARLGFPILDPLAATVVAVFVIQIGLRIGKDVFAELVESSVDERTIAKIKEVVLSVEGVLRIHDLSARRSGPAIIVEMHILVDGNISVQKGHQIADTVEHRLRQEVDGVYRATIHIDPIGRLT